MTKSGVKTFFPSCKHRSEILYIHSTPSLQNRLRTQHVFHEWHLFLKFCRQLLVMNAVVRSPERLKAMHKNWIYTWTMRDSTYQIPFSECCENLRLGKFLCYFNCLFSLSKRINNLPTYKIIQFLVKDNKECVWLNFWMTSSFSLSIFKKYFPRKVLQS